MARRSRSDDAREYIEHRLGAPLREARRCYDRLGWEVMAANGNRMFIDQELSYYLLEGQIADPRHDRVMFAPSYREMYNSIYATSFQAGTAQVAPIPYRMSPEKEMMYNHSVARREPEKPKPDLRAKKIRSLYWHRRSKTGKKPF